MTDSNAKVPDQVLGALQGSGFPFQTAVAQVVDNSGRWSISESEYPWHGPGGEDQFLDLVATRGELFLTIECKKTRKEIFTFLLPMGQSETAERMEFRCLSARQIPDVTRRVEIFCEEWLLFPKSMSSEFCIVSTGESGKDQRLLERDAGLLIRATEAYAQDFRERFPPGLNLPPPGLILPVIVTNARIYTARYRPEDISLETGEFRERPQDISSVPYVRFRKAFTSEGGRDLGDRSVFVVNAASLLEFLGHVRVAPSPMQPMERVSIQIPRRSRR